MSERDDREAGQQAVVALVRASLAGNHEAFRQLVEMKRDKVFRVAHHQLGNADDARVVAQAVFVRVWRNLSKYDPARSFDTWLHQVTVNAAIDHHRRRKARGTEVELDEAQHGAAPVADGLQAQEVQRILHELCAELPERQRAAFILREVDGLSSAEAAQTLGTTESTVRNHVFQARKFLREELIRRYPEYAGRAGRSDA